MTDVELRERGRFPTPKALDEPGVRERQRLASVRRLEFGLLLVLLLLLGLVAYGSYIQHAGFVTDDWSLRKAWVIRTDGGHLSGLGNFMKLFPGRPALGLYLGLVQAGLGFHQGAYLALALATAILFAISFYLVLRTLRLTALQSGIIAGLTLVFPASDSLRLWAIAGDASWALALLMFGALLTLRSFEAEGRRRIALRSGGLALYALSLTTYEIGMLPLAISFVLYRCRVPWREALRAWALDLPVIALVYLLATRHAGAQHLSLAGTLHHGLAIARDALRLMGKSVLPFGGSGWVTLGLAVALIALAAITYARLPAGDAVRGELRRWLSMIVVAGVFAAASYAIYAPGLVAYYMPLDPGVENRVNALGGPLLIAIAYALGALAALLLSRRVRGARRYAGALAAGFGLLLGGFYLVNTFNDAATWKRGYVRAQQVIDLMRSRIPKPPPGSLIMSFGQPVQEASGIPVWATTWDLDGAVSLYYHDVSLDGVPGITGTTIDCGATSAGPVNQPYPTLFTAADRRPYGKLYLFSTDGRWIAPRNRRQCLRVAPTFVPGPWTAPSQD